MLVRWGFSCLFDRNPLPPHEEAQGDLKNDERHGAQSPQ